jgi:phenylpropionate dioxygenase-like ring-hydroxylating dioxygenase large terminal subunit
MTSIRDGKAATDNAFLRNCWQVAAFANELDVAFLARRILNEPLILFRAGNGDVAALEDRCPHRLVPLSSGHRVGDALQCAYHGTVVAADGSCTKIPGQSSIPRNSATRAYPALDRYGLIWVWMGAPDLADANLVPDLRWLSHPEWVSSTFYMHFEADYRLVTDNLLDLSHETYIHQSTIGNREEESIADFRVTLAHEADRRIFCRREMSNIEPPPMWSATCPMADRIDRLQIASYVAPGINMTEAGYRIAGETTEYNVFLRVMHLLTPETEHSTHYFSASSRNYALRDAALTSAITDGTIRTFKEDKYILELQQRALFECPDQHVPKMSIVLDAGPIQGRRLLTAAIAREQADPTYVAPPLSLVRELDHLGSERAQVQA